MNSTLVPVSAVRPAEWRATYIFKPELRLLAESLVDYGWLAPIIVRSEDSTIIDGFARWLVAQADPRLRDGLIPVRFIDCDLAEAMLMHLRLNRGRGMLVPKQTSNVVKTILRSGRWDDEGLQGLLGMSDDEFDMLADGTLLKTRKLAEHKYSRAWVPVEAAPPGATVAGPVIERPPNPDR